MSLGDAHLSSQRGRTEPGPGVWVGELGGRGEAGHRCPRRLAVDARTLSQGAWAWGLGFQLTSWYLAITPWRKCGHCLYRLREVGQGGTTPEPQEKEAFFCAVSLRAGDQEAPCRRRKCGIPSCPLPPGLVLPTNCQQLLQLAEPPGALRPTPDPQKHAAGKRPGNMHL